MCRRTLSSGVAAAWLVVAAASAQASSRSEAESIATRTGEIIGGASACGISEGELVALGAKVIRWARDAARSAAELKRAQEAHEAAVQRSADRVSRRGASACDATVRTFRELEGSLK